MMLFTRFFALEYARTEGYLRYWKRNTNSCIIGRQD